MKSRKNILLLYAIAFLQGMVFYATISTLYREQRGLTLSDFAVIESISFLFTLLMEVPFGVLADRIGYKKTLALANGVYFLSKIVFWQAQGFLWFLLERFLLSAALAGISGVDVSILYLSGDQENRQSHFGVYAAFGTAGMLAGTGLFTLFLSDNYADSALWTVVSYGMAFLLTLFLDEVKDKTAPPSKKPFAGMGTAFRVTLHDHRFLLFILAVALVGNAGWMITVMLNQDKYLLLGIHEQQMGMIAIAVTAAGLCSAAAGFFTKRLGYKRYLTVFVVVAATAALLMGLTQSIVLAIVCNILVALCCGMTTPAINHLENEQVTLADRATQLSVYGMMVDILSIGLSLITAAVAKISLTSLFVLAAAELVVAVICFWVGHRKRAAL